MTRDRTKPIVKVIRIWWARQAVHVQEEKQKEEVAITSDESISTGERAARQIEKKQNGVTNTTELLEPEKSKSISREDERKPVALSVVETSGELVRSTKYSQNKTHAQDYVKIVEKRAGNITGMGIRYGDKGLPGSRLLILRFIKAAARHESIPFWIIRNSLYSSLAIVNSNFRFQNL